VIIPYPGCSRESQDTGGRAEATLAGAPVEWPEPGPWRRQGLCLEKGCDFDDVRDLALEIGCTPHIRARGEEVRAIKRGKGFKARRWVVERTHGWMNRFGDIDPPGEDPGELSGYGPFRLRPHHVQMHRRFRIGSKSPRQVFDAFVALTP